MGGGDVYLSIYLCTFIFNFFWVGREIKLSNLQLMYGCFLMSAHGRKMSAISVLCQGSYLISLRSLVPSLYQHLLGGTIWKDAKGGVLGPCAPCLSEQYSWLGTEAGKSVGINTFETQGLTEDHIASKRAELLPLHAYSTQYSYEAICMQHLLDCISNLKRKTLPIKSWIHKLKLITSL